MIDFSLKWTRVRIEYELKKRHHFDFIVPMIRGALGYSLYESYCKNKLVQCNGCKINSSCIYYRIFESPEYEGKKVKNFSIHPFQLSQYEYPMEEPGESKKISFYLTLFGEPEMLYPIFITELNRIGIVGLGKSLIKAGKMNVYNLEGNPLVSNGSNVIKSPPIYSIADVNSMIESIYDKPNKIKMKFITPLQIKSNGRLLNRINFSHIIRAIARRLNMIEKYYGGSNRIKADQILKNGGEVETIATRLDWVSHSRYSTRKKQKMPLPGIVGQLIISGDISRFFPLLLLGEIFHIGAKTTFGLGQFIIYSES